MGSMVEAVRAMVTVGSSIPVPTPPNATAITAFLPQQLFNFSDGVSGYFLYDAPAGIVTNIQAAPTGQYWAHLHVDNSGPNFTITDQNQVYSTESGGTDVAFAYASSSNHTIDNYQPANNYLADRNVLLYP
jgi:hypothetical protein